MGTRGIIRASAGGFEVAYEAPFADEASLHRAVAAHPEVLPSEDLGIGTLVALGVEINLGAGPMDMLAVDRSGRAVIVEFKRGPENPDVRRVIAQLLDYGSALWRTSVDDLERALVARRLEATSISDVVSRRLEGLGEESLDHEVFTTGLQTTLEAGDFVFLYVARNLDARTRRVMTYMAEGPRLSMFAVEVDHYRFDADAAVLVPRVGFVPSWVIESGASRVRPTAEPLQRLFDAADDDVRALDDRLAGVAHELGAVVEDSAKARHYRGARGKTAIALYPHWREAHFWLKSLRSRGEHDLAEQLRAAMRSIEPGREPAADDPSLKVDALLSHWELAEGELVRPYLLARIRHAAEPAPEARDADPGGS